MNGGSESVGKSDIGSLKDYQTTDPLNSICESTSVAATIDGANAPPPPPTITPITSAPADTGQTINEGSNSNSESVIGSPRDCQTTGSFNSTCESVTNTDKRD